MALPRWGLEVALILDYSSSILTGVLRTHLVRTSLILVTSQVLTYVLGFIFWLLVARYYPAEAVGLGVTLLTSLVFLSGLSTLGLPLGLVRFLPSEDDGTRLINESLVIAGCASLAVGLVFFAGSSLWAPTLGFVWRDPVFSGVFFLSLTCFALAAIVDSAFVASRRADYGLLRMTTYNFAKLPLPVVAASILGLFAILASWMIALVVSLTLSFAVLLPRLIKGFRVSLVLPGERGRKLIGYSLWNQAATIAVAAPPALLPLLIVNTLGDGRGPATAAFFFAAFAFASLLHIIPQSFSSSLLVEGSYGDSDHSVNLRRSLWLSSAFLAPAVVAAIGVGRWVLELFGQTYAQEGYGTMVLLVLSTPVAAVNYTLATDLQVTKRVKPLVVIMSISAVTTLLVAYILLPSLGVWGAGVGYSIGQLAAIPAFMSERWVSRMHRSRDPAIIGR